MTLRKVVCAVISHGRIESTLERALKSLRDAIDLIQSTVDIFEFKVVVIDDNSGNMSKLLDLIYKYRFQLCCIEPCKQVFAWEKAIEIANEQGADYLKILLDDDWVHKEYFGQLLALEVIKDTNLAVCAAKVQNHDLTLYKLSDELGYLPSCDFKKSALSGAGNGGMPESPSCCIFRMNPKIKMRYEEFDGTELEPYSRIIYFNDLLLLIDAAMSGEYVLFTPQTLVTFGTDADSLTMTKTNEVMKGRETFRNFVRKQGII